MKMNYDAIMGDALPLDGFVMGKMTVKMEVMKIHFSVRRYLICNLNCLLEVVLYICILQSWENFCWLYPKQLLLNLASVLLVLLAQCIFFTKSAGIWFRTALLNR